MRCGLLNKSGYLPNTHYLTAQCSVGCLAVFNTAEMGKAQLATELIYLPHLADEFCSRYGSLLF